MDDLVGEIQDQTCIIREKNSEKEQDYNLGHKNLQVIENAKEFLAKYADNSEVTPSNVPPLTNDEYHYLQFKLIEQTEDLKEVMKTRGRRSTIKRLKTDLEECLDTYWSGDVQKFKYDNGEKSGSDWIAELCRAGKEDKGGQGKSWTSGATPLKVALREFSGDLSEWNEFIGMYKALVHQTSKTPEEKLCILKMSLKGEPALLLKNVSGCQAKKVWSGDPKVLDRFAIEVQGLLAGLEMGPSKADHFLSELEEKLPLGKKFSGGDSSDLVGNQLMHLVNGAMVNEIDKEAHKPLPLPGNHEDVTQGRVRPQTSALGVLEVATKQENATEAFWRKNVERGYYLLHAHEVERFGGDSSRREELKVVSHATGTSNGTVMSLDLVHGKLIAVDGRILEVNILVDNCDTTLITERFRKKAGLIKKHAQRATISGSGGQVMETDTSQVSFRLKTPAGTNTSVLVIALTIDRITQEHANPDRAG
eukprot:TCALIF_13710-PA protein Name:"Protein of unknown function" AED:0.44 eAED:0.59 QI:2/0/0/0.83/0.2/0.16/6/0/476